MENENSGKKSVTKERSASYPAVSLEEAITYSVSLQSAFSKSPFSRENAVKEMGHQTVTGASGMKVSALVHYGLLDRVGNAYRNSELAVRFAHPIDDSDLQDAKKTAALSPKLFKDLFTEFAGRAIPTQLGSILVRHHKIGQRVANDVTKTFIRTLEHAGLYQNGIVSTELPIAEDSTDNGIAQSQSSIMPRVPEHTNNDHPVQNSQPGMHTVKLPSGIILAYPEILAYAFTIGTFSVEITTLDAAVAKEVNKHEQNNE